MTPESGADGRGEAGAALLTVLTVLVALGIAVTLLMDRSRSDIGLWGRQAEITQALYAAESGIAFQLYLERFSDSAEPEFGVKKDGESADFLGLEAQADTFAYRLDTLAAVPRVKVDRTRAYLDIISTGKYRSTEATLFARFGKALDDSIFGPALSLDNTVPLENFPSGQIHGSIRMRTTSPGLASLAWPPEFTVSGYISEFTDKRYYALESALQKKLSEDGAQSGNGNFSPDDPPDFRKAQDITFNLGRVELVNTGMEPWVIKGPGRIFSGDEIRVRGLVRLENVQLLAAKNVVFEDSITGEDISAFARGNVLLQGRCRLGLEAVAGKNIILHNRCQTTAGSVLLSVGGKGAGSGPDSINAVRVVNEAVARGFLIAGGPNGRVVLATETNLVEGVVMAASVWLSGTVHGPVLTGKLLCEGTNSRNCLGNGRIDRSLLPSDFVQPLQLGPQDRRQYSFKLMRWRRS